MDLQSEVRVRMRWREGQRFLVDNYNSWQDRYTWYMEIVDFVSNNDGGDITVNVTLRKHDENRQPLNDVTVEHRSLEDAVDRGDIEPIDRLDPGRRENVPDQTERQMAESLSL